MKTSLIRRVVGTLWTTLVAILLLQIGLGMALVYREVPSTLDDILVRRSEILGAALQDETAPACIACKAERLSRIWLERRSPDAPPKPGLSAHIDGLPVLIQILDGQGRLVHRSSLAPPQPWRAPGLGHIDLQDPSGSFRAYIHPYGSAGRIVMAHTQASRDSAKREILVGMFLDVLMVAIPSMAALLLVAYLVTRRALKPLRNLAATVEARKAAELNPLEDPMDLLETRPLVAALNRLFKKQEELLQSQARFVAEAAHELKTPLAVIGAQAHVLTTAKEEEEHQRAAEELRKGIDRGAMVVDQLLTVARMEAIPAAGSLAPLDLAELARTRASSLVPRALAKEQDLGYEGPDTLLWNGSERALGSALDNLMVNAIRHTPKGTHITLRLGQDSEGAWLQVEDTGPGIPPEFLERAFERFTRAPGTLESGSGLGLAIVAAAMKLHGGRVELANRTEGTGLVATLHLPRRLFQPQTLPKVQTS